VGGSDGRIWSWQGDGGLSAFHGDASMVCDRAVAAAFQIQEALAGFNASHCSLSEGLRARVAVHAGNARYRESTGRIHSEAINYVAHLEHEFSLPGHVTLSRDVHKELSSAIRQRLAIVGSFEGTDVFMDIAPDLSALPESIRWPADGKEVMLVSRGAFVCGERDVSQATGSVGRRSILLPDFYMDRFPVTNAEYKTFIDRTGYATPQFVNDPAFGRYNWRGREFPECRGRHPVVLITRDDAQAYAEWAKKELPSEHHWEKAARGTEGREYPWGDEFDAGRCNTPESGVGETTPVGLYPSGASPYGCCDMTGNVWEWTTSHLDVGDATTAVTKGGSWSDYECQTGAKDGRCAHRGGSPPELRTINRIGFRCMWRPASSSSRGRQA